MKTSNRSTAISAATHTHKEHAMKSIVLMVAAMATLTLTSCEASHSIADRTLTVKVEGAAGSIECTLAGTCEGNTEFNIPPQEKKDTKSSPSIPGEMAFTVCKGQFNVTCKPSAGLEMENSSIDVPMPDSDHTITMVVKKVDGSVVTTPADLTSNIAVVTNASSEIDAACLPKLITDTAGYKAGTVTRDALVATEAACSAKKQTGFGKWSTQTVVYNNTPTDNPKRSELKAALDTLNGKIEDAQKAIDAAWAALTAVVVVVVNPDAGQPDSGQPDSGQPDSGQPDAGQPDSGQPDAGPACQGVPEGALTMGLNPQFEVHKGGPALDISTTKVFKCQAGVLVQVTATCSHQPLDVAAVNNSCTTISPGGIAGCEWATVRSGTATPTRFKMYNYENGDAGVCP